MVEYRKYVQSVSVIIGLSVPNLNNYRGLRIGYIIYWIFTLSTITSIFIYIVSAEVIDKMDLKNLEISKLVLAIGVFVQITGAMIDMVIVKRRKVIKLNMYLSNLETHILEKFSKETKHKEDDISIEFFIYIVLSMTSVFADFAMEVCNFELGDFTVFVFYIQYYNFAVTMLMVQMHLYSFQIEKMFHIISKDIKKKSHKSKIYDFNNLKIDANEIMFYIRRYDDLYKAVDMVSEVYYKIIIIMVLCSSLCMVYGFKMAFELYVLKAKGIYTSSFEYYFWITIILRNMVSSRSN